MPWLVRQQSDGKFCVFKDAGGNPTGSSLGCHDSKEKAQAQIRALYANESVEISLETMETLCPSCAESMKSFGMKTLRFNEQMNPQVLDALCKRLGSPPGMFTRCMELGIDVTDKEAFCGWLKAQCKQMGASKPFKVQAASPVGELIEDETRQRGTAWEVVIFSFGRSSAPPHIVYTRESAERSIAIFDGAKVYANAEADRAGHKSDPNQKVTRDIVGVITNPRITDTDFRGTLNIYPAADWLRVNLLAAKERNLPVPYELSIDAQGAASEESINGETQIVAHHFDYASVDVVERGAAGGAFLRMVASKTTNQFTGGSNMKNKLLVLFSMLYPSFLEGKKVDVSGIDENELFTHLLEADKPQPRLHIPDGMKLTDTWLDEKIAKLREALTRDIGAEFANKLDKMLDKFGIDNAKEEEAKAAARESANKANIDLDKQVADKVSPIDEKVKAMEAKLCAAQLTSKLAESQLPTPLQELVSEQFQGKIFQEADLDAAISKTREKFGKMETVKVDNKGTDIKITDEEVDKIQRGVDGFFLCTNPTHPLTAQESKDMLKGVPPYKSIKRAYQDHTGDIEVSGLKKGRMRLTESLATTDWAEVVASALNKRMVRDYVMLPLDSWKQFVDVIPLSDFKQQNRIRTGGYANLPTRVEGAAYVPLTSPTDEQATYTPTTRGGTEDITREMIMNDDVGAVSKVPGRMARAAAQTLHEFVYEFVNPATNAVIYDSNAIYETGGAHGNYATTALGTDGVALFAARLLMRKQTQAGSSKRLGILAGFLLVPPELEQDAYDNLTPAFDKSNQVPEFYQAQGIVPIVVDYWTDATDWSLVARRSSGVGLEIGFVNGQEMPETFVSDVANVGSWFTNDKITYKIRHEYGGAITDYRFFTGNVVAG
jgi:hypothetical protein